MKMLKSIIFMSVGVTLVLCLSLDGYAKPPRAEIHEIAVFVTPPTAPDPNKSMAFAYLLISGKKTAIIDTGQRPLEVYIGPALEKLGMTFEDIDYILDTSFHGDHTKANFELKKESGAEIAIHESVAKYLTYPLFGYYETIASAVDVIYGGDYVQTHKDHHLGNPLSWTPPFVDWRLEEGDVIDLKRGKRGMKLKVLHLPGHETGDIGYYLKKEKILFAGGSVRGVNGVRGALPVIYDMDAYEQTIERIKAMKLKRLYTYHPGRSITIPSTNILVGKEIDQYLGEILESIDIMREAAEAIADAGTFQTFPGDFWASYDDFVLLLRDAGHEWGLKTVKQIGKQPFFGGVTFLNLMMKVLEARGEMM